MFKNQNKNSINIEKLKTKIKYFLLFFMFLGLFLNFGFSFEIKVGDALGKFYDKFKRNSEINQLAGKPFVEDIYNKSLEIVKNNNFIPIYNAMSKTLSNLNDEYLCQLNNQDIINILYFANSAFQRDFRNNLNSFIKPNRDDMGISCNKLNVCIFKPEGGALQNTPNLNQSCQRMVENEFIKYYVDSYYIHNMSQGNHGSNYFWNFSLEDSSYDIMNDVHVLSKILFENAEKPSQTLFYKMPSINYNMMYQEPEINMNIDRFSPYNTYTTTVNQTEVKNDDNTDTKKDIVPYSTGVVGDIDQDIKQFIESTNFNMGSKNPDFILLGNQCVSGFEYEGLNTGIESVDGSDTLEPGKYLSGVLDDIAKVSCNNDGICQTWETTSCPDCINQGGNPDFEEIEQLLKNIAENADDININDPVLGCFQKCQRLPCNVTNCDKLVCYAKCACQTYESPIFDPIKNPGLSSVFKIKFCIIPVMENKITEKKTVYNIASIFTELYNVLQNLRNSGQMMINVKTKEFLDTSYKDNSFSDQISFSINSNIKPVSQNKSDLTKQQEQIEFNNSLMQSVLGFSKDPALEKEKNKYVVMDDPCEYKVNKQSFDSPEQRLALLNNCRQELNMNIVLQNIDLEGSLQDQNTILLQSEIDTFLLKNRDFWYEIRSMFFELNETAKILSNK